MHRVVLGFDVPLLGKPRILTSLGPEKSNQIHFSTRVN